MGRVLRCGGTSLSLLRGFMSTYENCYEILGSVRHGLNEYSDNLHSGTDTSGAHQNSYLVKMINKAQRHIYGILLPRMPEVFLESTSLTGVDSVFTLPADFGRLLYFKDENGNQVFKINPKKLRLTEETGSDQLYYRKGNTLVLDKAGVTKTYTLIYYRRPRDLDQGKASAGAATSITLATSAKLIVDYYNGMVLENITQDWTDTIDDYTVARVATVSETAVAADIYGIVSDLPEPFHFLIASKAIMLVKTESPVAQEKITKYDLSAWHDQLVEALTAYSGSDDGDVEDLFLDFDVNNSVLSW